MGVKVKKIRRKLRRELGRSIPVTLSMAGLRRPRSSWSTSVLDHTSASRGASTSGTGRRINTPAQGSPASDRNQNFPQPGEPDSDSDVNPRRQFRMSALIDSKVQAAMAGAGFVKERYFPAGI